MEISITAGTTAEAALGKADHGQDQLHDDHEADQEAHPRQAVDGEGADAAPAGDPAREQCFADRHGVPAHQRRRVRNSSDSSSSSSAAAGRIRASGHPASGRHLFEATAVATAVKRPPSATWASSMTPIVAAA